jgi:hypothetical protein
LQPVLLLEGWPAGTATTSPSSWPRPLGKEKQHQAPCDFEREQRPLDPTIAGRPIPSRDHTTSQLQQRQQRLSLSLSNSGSGCRSKTARSTLHGCTARSHHIFASHVHIPKAMAPPNFPFPSLSVSPSRARRETRHLGGPAGEIPNRGRTAHSTTHARADTTARTQTARRRRLHETAEAPIRQGHRIPPLEASRRLVKHLCLFNPSGQAEDVHLALASSDELQQRAMT